MRRRFAPRARAPGASRRDRVTPGRTRDGWGPRRGRPLARGPGPAGRPVRADVTRVSARARLRRPPRLSLVAGDEREPGEIVPAHRRGLDPERLGRPAVEQSAARETRRTVGPLPHPTPRGVEA